MATTNLIVDFLVIGVSSFTWIIPLFFLIGRDSGLTSILSSDNAGIWILALGFIYIIGISINRLADDIFERQNNKWKDDVFGKSSEVSYHKMLNIIIASSESASDYLSYRRSIIRISRACSINFFLGFIFWTLSIFINTTPLQKSTIILLSFTSAIICTLLFRALPVVLKGYFSTIKDIYEKLIVKTKEMADGEPTK